jgi:hypothetical protein
MMATISIDSSDLRRLIRQPNLAKEAVKDKATEAFFRTTSAVVASIVEKHLLRALK